MAKIPLGKFGKLSKSQQYLILAVGGAALFLGVAMSIVLHFVGQISFNAEVIAEEDKAIASYSKAIREIGVCTKPAGDVYTDEELKKCNPDSIEASRVPGSLKANIIENMAASEVLNSVPKENTSECLNPETEKNFTYEELEEIYDNAETTEELVSASKLIRSCSALRVVPDALPAFKNEEALLSSLNKIFILSDWEPESLSPTGNISVSALGVNLNAISVRLSVEANTATTHRVLDNIEKSIREFNIERATIEWGGNDSLVLQAQATAYYMDESTIVETTKTIKPKGVK